MTSPHHHHHTITIHDLRFNCLRCGGLPPMMVDSVLGKGKVRVVFVVGREGSKRGCLLLHSPSPSPSPSSSARERRRARDSSMFCFLFTLCWSIPPVLRARAARSDILARPARRRARGGGGGGSRPVLADGRSLVGVRGQPASLAAAQGDAAAPGDARGRRHASKQCGG